MKLLTTPLVCGAGNAARMAAAAGEILLMGIRFPGNWLRPVPVFNVPDCGSKTLPPPPTPAVKYSLRSQKPGVALVAFVAGLQVVRTSFVGTVKFPLTPLDWRVP